jgi:hypothetical protein
MVESRQSTDWNHTASILAMIAAVNRDPKKGRMPRPSDFHPFLKKHGKPAEPVIRKGQGFGILRQVFVDPGMTGVGKG